MNEFRKSRPSFRGGDRPGRSERPSSRGERTSYKSSSRPSFRDEERSEKPRFGGSRGEKSFSDRKPFGEKSFGDRKFSDRKPFGESKSGSRKPFSSRGAEERSFSERSFGDRKFGERKPFGEKSFGDRKFSDRKPFGENKFGERKPFGRKYDDKKYSDKNFGKRPVATTPKPEKEDDGTLRLNKFIANSGVCSRREADEFIQAGLVTVNGNVVTELGVRVKRTDDIRFNGERLKGEQKVYILMNKPKDYVTTTSDPHAEKNVMQLISKEKCSERIFPVGRLDKATTGVLLLTNDGELTEKLTHPSYQKKKIYQVELDRAFHQSDMDKLVQGISLEDGVSFADEAAYVDGEKNIIGVEIHSGKNRIVRRMFEALGYDVRRLDRVYFAGLTKKNLRRGQWRFLSDEEVRMIKMNFYE